MCRMIVEDLYEKMGHFSLYSIMREEDEGFNKGILWLKSVEICMPCIFTNSCVAFHFVT